MNKAASQAKRQVLARPAFAPGVLQRKCACGNHTGAGGECDECGKKETLQRKATSKGFVGQVPAIVNEVLRSPGQPLDVQTRAFFEPRFGHDFSQVRLHADAKAAESARAVNALAYTVGSEVVFGPGRFSPTTTEGRLLLTHELTHVVQQSASGAGQLQTSRISQPGEPGEQEAEFFSQAVLEAVALPVVVSTPPQVARQKTPDGKSGTEKKAPEQANHTKQTLSSDDKKRIKGALQATAPATVPKFAEGPRYVLHDTASRVEPNKKEREEVDAGFLKKWKEAHKEEPKEDQAKKKLEKLKKKELEEAIGKARQKKERTTYEGHERNERGPLDEGAAAWIPEGGTAVIARPQFFDPRRPATTQYERRADIIAMEPRERAFEKVWQATNPAERQAALQASLAGLEVTPRKGESKKEETERAIRGRRMTPEEMTAERKKAEKQLAKPLPTKFPRDEKPHFWTTAAWSVEKICDQLKKKKAEDLAVSEDKAKDLEAGCRTLGKYLTLREPRLGSTVNVELSKPAGSACNSNEKKVTLLPLPPYTASQYQETALVYLRAALQAEQFPEVTTHFWLDSFDPSGHCDPRCFDLQHFYDEVAVRIGHRNGSLYGIRPNYGTTRGTHNVWWHSTVCGGSHP